MLASEIGNSVAAESGKAPKVRQNTMTPTKVNFFDTGEAYALHVIFNIEGFIKYETGAPSGGRTHTWRILSPLPLPLGYRGHAKVRVYLPF